MRRLNFVAAARAAANGEPPPSQSRYRRPPRPPGYTAEDFEASAYHRRTQRATVARLERVDRGRELAIAESAARDRAAQPAWRDRDPVLDEILTTAELEEQRRTTPRPPPRDVVTDEDLAASFEGAWSSWAARAGAPVPVVASVVISDLRRGGAR